MLLKSVIIAVALSAGVVQAQDHPWGNTDVDAYVFANRPVAPTSNDPFTAPPAQATPAAHVVLEYPRRGPNDPQVGLGLNTTRWQYDVARSVMTITVGAEFLFGRTLNYDWQGQEASLPTGNRSTMQQGWLTSMAVRDLSSSTGTNAFGATREVTNGTIVLRGIAVMGTADGSVGPAGSRGGTYRYEHPVSPDDGRALAPNLRVQVLADTRSWAPGKYVICGTKSDRATFDRPSNTTMQGCYLTTHITSVRIIDNRDGTVLTHWDAP